MRQEAFAVVDTSSGEVQLNTVHDTERGAKVNGLLVLFKILVTALWSDQMIDSRWREETCRSRYNIGRVTVVWVEKE